MDPKAGDTNSLSAGLANGGAVTDDGRHRLRSLSSAALWVGALVTAAIILVRIGQEPSWMVDWHQFGSWLATTDLETALAGLARVVALAIIGWIGLTSLAYATARLIGIRHPLRWLSVGPLRRAIDTLVAGSLILGTMTTTTLPAAAAVAPIPPSVESTTEPVSDLTLTDPAYIPIPAGGEGAAPDRSAIESAPTTVTVAPGDNLWNLARDRLTTVRGRPPTDHDTFVYWRKVIETNRDGLRSGDPDLIFPGEVIVLPEPTARPGN